MTEESLQNQEPKYPEGFENWPLDRKEAFIRGEQINPEPERSEPKPESEIIPPDPLLKQEAEPATPEPIQNIQEKSELADKIENANSFDELYEVLRKAGGVKGSSDTFYSAENIIAAIDVFRKTRLSFQLNFITKSEGLRDKVEKLLTEEPIVSAGSSISGSEPETAPVPVSEPVAEVESSPVILLTEEQKKEALKMYDEAVKNKNPEPASAQAMAGEEENIPEWQKGEEWKKLETLRTARAGIQNEFKKGIVTKEYLGEINTNYENARNLVGEKIKESLKKEASENLTPEQEAELNSKINDTLFDELVVKENDAYLKALREARGETAMDKALESAKNLLNTKAVKWYLGLSKKERMLVNFGIGSIAGLTFGATVAPGMVGVASYLAWRAARTVLSGSAGAVAGEWANKKWSAEELQKVEEKETEDLKNSELSLEEKSKGLLDIEKRFKKEKIKMALKKMGTTVAAGAGTGLIFGLAEHAVMGAGGAAKSALETKGGKVGGLTDNKLPGRKGFEPIKTKTSTPVSETAPVKPTPILKEIIPPKPVEPVALKSVEPVPTQTEKLFADPKILLHEVKAGDSPWKILKSTLENNEQFKDLTEAQKTYVLSTLTNKMLQHPENYGLHNGGGINIGDKTDFTKLFEDTKEVKSILNKAQQTIAAHSAQEQSILTNNTKISNWVKANPDEPLTEDKVSEILSNKPKAEINPEFIPEVHKPEANMPNNFGGRVTNLSGGTALAGAAFMGALGKKEQQQMHSEIVEEIDKAKERLVQLEKENATKDNKDKIIRNPNLERSFASDSELTQRIDEAFRSGVNDIYGKSGFLGLGKVEGINTREWKEMARLSASKVVEYYTGDSTKSGLADEITKSKKHNALMSQMAELMGQTNGAIKANDPKENMEQFIKRLASYISKADLQKLSKAA
jgi:hypothetical protein